MAIFQILTCHRSNRLTTTLRNVGKQLSKLQSGQRRIYPRVLDEVRPDLVCVDNVILFPAIKRYARDQGKPWVRIISCSENEIPDPDIPPHLSGCGESDQNCFRKYEQCVFLTVIDPIHERFNQFLAATGEDPYPIGQFFEASPYMNLLLYPEPVKFKRRQPLDRESISVS